MKKKIEFKVDYSSEEIENKIPNDSSNIDSEKEGRNSSFAEVL